MTSVGVGWVEGDEDHLADLMRGEVINVAAGLGAVPCELVRSDKTDPPLTAGVFRQRGVNGGPREADDIDLLVLAGHGSGAGGVMIGPDAALTSRTAAFGGRMRCAVFVSCAILEGDPDSETVSPFGWRLVFDGLHMLIAPRTFVSASPGRGARFARHLADGLSFVDAWTRACWESGSPESDWRVLVRGRAIDVPELLGETLLDPLPDAAGAEFQLVDLG